MSDNIVPIEILTFPISPQVKTIVHRAFWDLLSEQLKESPPCFDQAIVLLKEIKETILGLLVPQQKRLIENINSKLDVDLISQQEREIRKNSRDNFK
jgi:hypothetical protein